MRGDAYIIVCYYRRIRSSHGTLSPPPISRPRIKPIHGRGGEGGEWAIRCTKGVKTVPSKLWELVSCVEAPGPKFTDVEAKL